MLEVSLEERRIFRRSMNNKSAFVECGSAKSGHVPATDVAVAATLTKNRKCQKEIFSEWVAQVSRNTPMSKIVNPEQLEPPKSDIGRRHFL